MNGYIRVNLSYAGGNFNCWQKIENGAVIGYVDSTGVIIPIPEVREETILNPDLFAALP